MPTLGSKSGDLAAQDLTWTGFEGFVGDEAVTHHACIARHPRQGTGRAGRTSRPVGRSWAAARQVAACDGRSGKGSALGQQVIQVSQRYQLAPRHTVDVGELSDQRVHAFGRKLLSKVLHLGSPAFCSALILIFCLEAACGNRMVRAFDGLFWSG